MTSTEACAEYASALQAREGALATLQLRDVELGIALPPEPADRAALVAAISR